MTLHRVVAVGGSVILGAVVAAPAFVILVCVSLFVGPAFTSLAVRHGEFGAALIVSAVLAGGLWLWLAAHLLIASWHPDEDEAEAS